MRAGIIGDRQSGRAVWRNRRVSRSIAVFLFLAATSAAPLAAQATGRITGQVVQATTGTPISGVQVFLQGTQIGTHTNPSGRYVLINIPAGSHTVRVERIGYKATTRAVSVVAGGSAQADFRLAEEVLRLDEVVVTGTAGAARKREIGNSIALLDLQDRAEPLVSVDAALQGRAAGLLVLENTGQVGGGATIRLRGNVSAAMSNQPLVYIDGVRVRSDGLPKNVPPGYSGRGPNTTYSPLNDVNPNDILRIEVIRGAAATTLYGTEADAGVIQIFTKRGEMGRPRWTLQVDQGLNVLHRYGPTEGVHGEPLVTPPGEQDPDHMYMEPFLRHGHRQKYSLSVAGGFQDVQYFVSGALEKQEGVIPTDLEEKTSIRGNVGFSPLSGLQLNWNTSYTNNDMDQVAAGPNAHGIVLNAFRRDGNYIGTDDPDALREFLEYENNQYVDRFVTGITATYTPAAAFTNRLIVGYDLIQQQTTSLRPFGWVLAPDGIIHDTRWQASTLTLDYVGSLTTSLTSALTSAFSFGGQSVAREESAATAYGEKFPGPGRPTVSSAAVRLGEEDFMRVVNAGVFVQEMLSFRDRYFLTGGLRVDGNSAFGEDLGLQAYPKVSFSYVISDEPFWRASLGQLKLRAAYGQAGRAPGAFDAVRTWNPVGWGGQPAFRPANRGNPNLGPERTAEIELGFDGSFLNDRLGLEFTWYRARTTDALFAVSVAPSAGFAGSQLENVGALQNSGIELFAKGNLLETSSWGVELGASLTTHSSEVLDLGGANPFSIGGNGWIDVGYPVPVVRGQCITNPTEVAEPVVQQDCNYGPNLPTRIVGMSADLRFPHGLLLSARGEYQGGAWAYSTNDGEAFTRGTRWPSCNNAYIKLDNDRAGELTALERARCIASNAHRNYAIYPLDFFKLREVTLSAPVPIPMPGATSSQIALSARNAYSWREAGNSFLDPESSGGFGLTDAGMNARTRTVGGSISVPAVYTLSIRATF